MKITRKIITDLLPIYYSGEASEDTKALVEEFSKKDPEYKNLASSEVVDLNLLSSIGHSNQAKMETMMRIKRILYFRSLIFGVALFCTFMPYTVMGNSSQGVYWIMMRDQPLLAIIFGIIAFLSWGLYFWTLQSVRD
jgi:hypothetical protein